MSASGYQHSEVFAALKNTKEVITENLTTFQYLTSLDFFIEAAIDPIATAFPSLLDVFFAKVVAWQVHRPSIKYSREAKHALPVLLFNSVTTRGENKRAFQRKMHLNRGLLFGILSVFARTVNTYKHLHDPSLKISRTRRLLGIRLAEQRAGCEHLYSAIRQSDYWADKAYKFKGLIVQKYTRLALVTAKGVYKDIEHQMNLNDVIQIHLIYLSKAIDRCDSRQGVLTRFIQTWFYSAKSDIQKTLERDRKTSSFDDLLEAGADIYTVGPNTDYEIIQHVSHVAKRIDRAGVLRYLLHIPEAYSSRDLKKLNLFTT